MDDSAQGGEPAQPPEDEERDGQLLYVDERGMGIMCECGTIVELKFNIDTAAADFDAAVLPVFEAVCSQCTQVKNDGKKAVIPLHVAVGQHHVELVDDEADDIVEPDQPEPEQQEPNQ